MSWRCRRSFRRRCSGKCGGGGSGRSGRNCGGNTSVSSVWRETSFRAFVTSGALAEEVVAILKADASCTRVASRRAFITRMVRWRLGRRGGRRGGRSGGRGRSRARRGRTNESNMRVVAVADALVASRARTGVVIGADFEADTANSTITVMVVTSARQGSGVERRRRSWRTSGCGGGYRGGSSSGCIGGCIGRVGCRDGSGAGSGCSRRGRCSLARVADVRESNRSAHSVTRSGRVR